MLRVTLAETFNLHWLPDANTGCWEWQGALSPKGYGRLVTDCGWVEAHRYSYFLHCGDLTPGLVIRHSCDNPKCVSPKHLLQGTQKQNMHDAIKRGRWSPKHDKYVTGHGNARAVLSEAQVSAIRRDYIPWSRTHGAQALANKYGVSRQTIDRCIHKETYTT